jgi:type I restriction-modification system DNA methylase subunit
MLQSDNQEKQEFSDLSKKLTKNITKEEKKNNGIFFTPPSTIIKNINILEPYLSNINTVLEPSCGSCEYLLYLHNYKNRNKKHNKVSELVGVEYNNTIYESIKEYENTIEGLRLYNMDYLSYEAPKKFDLIIGNPPYFVLKKNMVNKEYYDYFDGRPNIFILFIIKSLSLLAPDGILSFILPKSFLNCLYYDKTRKYIYENYKILHISECKDDYLDTQQETILFIIQNTRTQTNIENKNYYLNILDQFTIFGTIENINKLNNYYQDSKSLKDLGFTVCVGNIVWNQNKSILTDDASKTLLIYSSNIQSNTLTIKKYANDAKKSYINKKGLTGPLLVINRGYGVGDYNFEYCLINTNKEYLIENHLICVKYNEEIDDNELVKKYENIIKSLENIKTKEFVKLYFGNNAINTTELCEILPIW